MFGYLHNAQSNHLQFLSNMLWLQVAPPFPLHMALQQKDIMYNHKSSIFKHFCGTYIYFSNFLRRSILPLFQLNTLRTQNMQGNSYHLHSHAVHTWHTNASWVMRKYTALLNRGRLPSATQCYSDQDILKTGWESPAMSNSEKKFLSNSYNLLITWDAFWCLTWNAIQAHLLMRRTKFEHYIFWYLFSECKCNPTWKVSATLCRNSMTNSGGTSVWMTDRKKSLSLYMEMR